MTPLTPARVTVTPSRSASVFEVDFNVSERIPAVRVLTRCDMTGMILEVRTFTYLPPCKGSPYALLHKVAEKVQAHDGNPEDLFGKSDLWDEVVDFDLEDEVAAERRSEMMALQFETY